MAVRAGELAFNDRMVRRLHQLRADLLVAAGARFVLQLARRRDERADGRVLFLERDVLRLVDHVAAIARDFIFLVASGFPEREMAIAAMAAQTGLLALVRRNVLTLLAEDDVGLRS